jgi:hypothetical protein
MNLIHAVVNVSTEQYAGPAVVVHSNGDDTVTVLEEVSGQAFPVHKEALELAPVTEQSVEWISQQLLEAWQPFLARIARHLAERLQCYDTLGKATIADKIFQDYLKDPGKAFRELCHRKV